jgi:hypothetical protein
MDFGSAALRRPGTTVPFLVMRGLGPRIHVFLSRKMQDVDGRDKFTAGPARGRTRLHGHDDIVFVITGRCAAA